MVTYRAFDEIIDFITSSPAPEEILAFSPPTHAQQRLEELLEKKRNESLVETEKQELDQAMWVEHLMRMAKARARQRLAA